MLAYAPTEIREQVLRDDPYTSNEELEKLKEAGYAVSQGERDPSVVSVAAPIFGPKGEMEYALFLTGPVGRMETLYSMNDLVASVRKAAAKVSLLMGYRP